MLIINYSENPEFNDMVAKVMKEIEDDNNKKDVFEIHDFLNNMLRIEKTPKKSRAKLKIIDTKNEIAEKFQQDYAEISFLYKGLGEIDVYKHIYSNILKFLNKNIKNLHPEIKEYLKSEEDRYKIIEFIYNLYTYIKMECDKDVDIKKIIELCLYKYGFALKLILKEVTA